MTSPADWIAGARPRTLPAAVAPVLAGTGAAAYVDHAGLGDLAWWKALLGLVVSLGLKSADASDDGLGEGVGGSVGERVGVWVLDAGPNRPSSLHVVGGHFDTT